MTFTMKLLGRLSKLEALKTKTIILEESWWFFERKEVCWRWSYFPLMFCLHSLSVKCNLMIFIYPYYTYRLVIFYCQILKFWSLILNSTIIYWNWRRYSYYVQIKRLFIIVRLQNGNIYILTPISLSYQLTPIV